MEVIKCNYLTLGDILLERSRNPEIVNKTVDFSFEKDIEADNYGVSLIAPFNEPIKTLALGRYGSTRKTEFHTPKFITGDISLYYKSKLFEFISKNGGDPYCIYAEVYKTEKKYKIN